MLTPNSHQRYMIYDVCRMTVFILFHPVHFKSSSMFYPRKSRPVSISMLPRIMSWNDRGKRLLSPRPATVNLRIFASLILRISSLLIKMYNLNRSWQWPGRTSRASSGSGGAFSDWHSSIVLFQLSDDYPNYMSYRIWEYLLL